MVLTAPPVTVKLVLLNEARPFTEVLASLMVIVPLAVETLPAEAPAMVMAPVWLLMLATPPEPGQVEKAGAPAVEIRHWPAPPATTDVKALAPWPTITPLVANEVAPVPPLPTDSALLNVRPAKVGVALVLMPWIVLTAPLVTEKLVLLKLAIPRVEVVAVFKVIVLPLPLELLTVKAPVRPSSVATPPEPGQVEKAGAPAVETKQSPAPPAVMPVIALAPLPNKMLLAVKLLAPVPPWTTVNAVVRPERLVMSLLAPLAAAPMLPRAPLAVVAPVPPWVKLKAVVRPDREVMSELAPLAAAPRLLRAPDALLAPVPPSITANGPTNVRLPDELRLK